MSSVSNDPVWIEVNVEGKFPKRQYFGRFQIKPYLTLAERRDAAVIASTYVRGVTEDPMMKALLTSLAILKFHILKSEADWWLDDGLGLLDSTPVDELIKLITEIQDPQPKEASNGEQP